MDVDGRAADRGPVEFSGEPGWGRVYGDSASPEESDGFVGPLPRSLGSRVGLFISGAARWLHTPRAQGPEDRPFGHRLPCLFLFLGLPPVPFLLSLFGKSSTASRLIGSATTLTSVSSCFSILFVHVFPL